jgi:hypothetical protein
LKDWRDLAVLLAVGGLIITAISSFGRSESFGLTFIYVISGVATCGAAVTATVVGFAMVGRRWSAGESIGFLAAGWIIGIFVTAPLLLSVVFRFLRTALG